MTAFLIIFAVGLVVPVAVASQRSIARAAKLGDGRGRYVRKKGITGRLQRARWCIRVGFPRQGGAGSVSPSREKVSELVVQARWAISDVCDWLMSGRRRYVVITASWLAIVATLVVTVGHLVWLAIRETITVSWWAAWHPRTAVLYGVLVVLVGYGVRLWARSLGERGPIPVRVAFWALGHASAAALFVAWAAWAFRSGPTTGIARLIWRTSRLKTDADTRVDRKTHGGRRLPGRVIDATRIEVPRRVDGTRQPPVGLIAHIRLPGGWTIDDLDHARIASGTFRTITARVSKKTGKGPEHVQVALLRRDPLLAVIEAGPPVAGHCAIGIDEFGRTIVLDLAASNLACGGLSRSGKTNMLQLVVGAFAADPRASLYILDGKNVDFAPWRERASGFVGAEPGIAVGIIGSVRDLVDKRYARMGELGHADWREMPPAMAAEFPAVFLLCDETPIYTSDPEHGAAIIAGLLDVLRRGLAANIHVALATQKATGDAMPTSLRDNCGTRAATVCSNREMGEAILAGGRGQLAADLPGGDLYRGRLIVVHEDGEIVYGRAWRVTRSWLERHARQSKPSTKPRRDAPAPAPRSGAGAPPRACADDPTAARASAHDASADTPAHEEPARETREQRRARNVAAHEQERAAWLAGYGPKPAPLEDDDTPDTRPALAVVGGVKRREEESV